MVNRTQEIKRIHTWIPPERGFHKMDVVASVAREGTKGAVGVVCRNDQGLFLAASASVCPTGSC